MSYINLKSSTWWVGIACISTGVMMMMGAGEWANVMGEVISRLQGGTDASPAGLIYGGLAAIGLRAKLERSFSGEA